MIAPWNIIELALDFHGDGDAPFAPEYRDFRCFIPNKSRAGCKNERTARLAA